MLVVVGLFGVFAIVVVVVVGVVVVGRLRLFANRRRLASRSWCMRVSRVSGVWLFVVVLIALVGLEMALVVGEGCWCGSRRLVNLACRNRLGLSRRCVGIGFGSSGGSF